MRCSPAEVEDTPKCLAPARFHRPLRGGDHTQLSAGRHSRYLRILRGKKTRQAKGLRPVRRDRGQRFCATPKPCNLNVQHGVELQQILMRMFSAGDDV